MMKTLQDNTRRDAGFTLIELGLVVLVLAILATLAIPALLTARKNANEVQAISALRSINNAQEMFHRREGDFGTVEELVAAGDLDETFDPDDDRRGYRFFDEYDPTTSTWAITAEPTDPGATGDRFFYIDISGVIRFAEDGPADDDANPVQ